MMEAIELANSGTSFYKYKFVPPKPFVKWVGGKRGIINELLSRLPSSINNYYEPFVGGGALFFEIYNKVNFSYLSDVNFDLIVAYKTIQTKLPELIDVLKEHHKNHSKDYYYKLRGVKDISDPVESTARFIYLMKTCFNGLFRVNKRNEFNTPIGSYNNPQICNVSNLLSVSRALKVAQVNWHNYLKIEPIAGDFVYFDPPYQPLKSSSFTSYTKNGFTEKDQIELKDFALYLSKKGVNVMISNSYTKFILELYSNDFKINKIKAPRLVNCKAKCRGVVKEVLITSY